MIFALLGIYLLGAIKFPHDDEDERHTSVPRFFLALGLCWKAGAAAEVIGLPASTIGERLYTAKVYFQTPDLFAWTAVIVALSVLFEKLFLALVDTLAGKAMASSAGTARDAIFSDLSPVFRR